MKIYLKTAVLIILLAGMALIIWAEPAKPAAKPPEKKPAPPAPASSAPLAEPQTITPKTFIAIGKVVSPAVVNITVIVVQGGQRAQGVGTGSIVDKKKGYVLTNAHVIKGAESITVVLQDKRELQATLVGSDEPADIAVIQITNPPADIPQVTLGDSNKLEAGEFAIAIGNPLGLGHNLTVGVVSALIEIEKDEDYIMEMSSFIQTDATLNPGNSGGPLINLRGEVIGVNTLIIQSGGRVGQGINRSIPINRARALMEVLIKEGKVARPYLGIATADINERLARLYHYPDCAAFLKELGIDKPAGAFVQSVVPNSPAQTAGFREGDIIIEIGKTKVETPKHISRALGKVKDKPEDVDIKIIRDGKEQVVKITLEVK